MTGDPPPASRALLLGGGGARAAYQAGVLRFIREISEEPGGKVPFEILVGVSAGAINLAGLAANASSFRAASIVMARHWDTLTTARVFKTGMMTFLLNSGRWLLDLVFGGAVARKEPRARSLVDATPLRGLVQGLLTPGRISEHIRRGVLHGVAVSAMDYSSGQLTVFIETSGEKTLWRRSSRTSRHDRIRPEHVLASCALPILFPAVRIGDSLYGDGSIHNMAPISPAIHLGARKVLAIGAREARSRAPRESDGATAAAREVLYPAPARILGVLLDSIFMDSLEADREQMERINGLLDLIDRRESRAAANTSSATRLRKIDFLYLGPSEDLGEIALRHRDAMPRSVRYRLGGLGAEQEAGGEFLSYLLFEARYCRELMDLGYRDAKRRAEEIRWFLWGR